jgi:hypothetical protein
LAVLDYLIIFLIVGIFVYLFVQLRRKGRGSSAHTFITSYGATDAFYHREKKKAIEIIADINSNKKMEEQSSSDNEDIDENL